MNVHVAQALKLPWDHITVCLLCDCVLLNHLAVQHVEVIHCKNSDEKNVWWFFRDFFFYTYLWFTQGVFWCCDCGATGTETRLDTLHLCAPLHEQTLYSNESLFPGGGRKGVMHTGRDVWKGISRFLLVNWDFSYLSLWGNTIQWFSQMKEAKFVNHQPL